MPSESADEYMLVRIHDLQRIRKRIDEELSPRHENISAGYFALFGAALATGVAVPPLLTASGLPSWIIPTFIVSASSFLVLGLVLVFVSCTVRKGQKRAGSEVAQEMRDLEETYRGKKTVTRVERD